MGGYDFPDPPPGRPGNLSIAARRLRMVEAELRSLSRHVRSIGERLYDEQWRGRASVAFIEHCDHIQWIMGQLADRADQFAAVCQRWSDDLQAAQDRHAAARERYWDALGRARTLEMQFLQMDGPSAAPALGSVFDESAVAEARLRTARSELHAAVLDGEAARADAAVAAHNAAAGFAGIDAPALGAMTDRLFGSDGRYARFGESTGAVLAGAEASLGARAQHVPAAATHLRRIAGFVSFAGAGVTGLSAALERRSADAANPFLTPEERTDRAVTDGLMQGAGAMAAGAAIGAVVAGPFGALAGAVVGAHLLEPALDRALDHLRGEGGVPTSESIVPDGNPVVAPPLRSRSREVPFGHHNDLSIGHLGFRTEQLMQPSGPSAAYREAVRTALEGVDGPQTPPPSQVPEPG